VTETHLGGLTVLVKRRPGAELVAVQLFLRGGSRNWTAADAGVEALAVRVAATGGTSALDKEAFGRRLAALGGTLAGSTGRDWSVLAAKGPIGAFEPLLGLLTDTFLAPALPAAEVEVARAQQLAALAQARQHPDGALDLLVNAALFEGHPYANRPEGTASTVAALTREQLVAHLARLRFRERLVLVVVGDVAPGRVLSLARATLGRLPEGGWRPEPLPRPAYAAPSLTTEARQLPTNYLQAMYLGPGPREAGYVAARVAQGLLWERLFEEVRTKRNLSYAPGARYEVTEAASFGGIYVTAVSPDTTLPVMLAELRRLKDEPVGAEELDGAKATFRTRALMNRETTDAQADALGRWLLLAGDWRFADRQLREAAAVTPAVVQAYARGCIERLQVVLLGDPASLDERLAKSL
jgi:predicted Zn-dependent peptidase